MKFKVFRFKKVKSTNNTALRLIKRSKFNFGMIISELQSNGRGQYGRKWISLKGNLFVSFFFTLKNIRFSLKKLTIINCLLVKQLISKYYNRNIVYKKPNDLMINKRKICGILQETINKFDNKFLIVGIGINLIKNPVLDKYPSICLKDLINKNVSKNKIENELKKIFEENLNKIYKKKMR